MRYVISTVSPRTGKTLFMVDRNKEQKGFWSLYLDDVYQYHLRQAAEKKAKTFQHNNPKVLSMNEARKICDAQRQEETK